MKAPDAPLRRHCTDLPCLALFAGALACLGFVFSLALKEGDVLRLILGSDVAWDACGSDNRVATTGLPLRTTVTTYPPGHSLLLRERMPQWMGGGSQDELAIRTEVLRGGRDLRERPFLYYLLPPAASSLAPGGVAVCVAQCPNASSSDSAPDGWPCVDFVDETDDDRPELDSCALQLGSAGGDDWPPCSAPSKTALASCADPAEACGRSKGGRRVCLPAYDSVSLLGAYCLPADAQAPASVLTRARAYDTALEIERETPSDSASVSVERPREAARIAWERADSKLKNSAAPASEALQDPFARLQALAFAPGTQSDAADASSAGLVRYGVVMMLWADVVTARSLIGWCVPLVLILAGLWLLAMRHFAALIVWIPIALIFSGLVGGGAYLHFFMPLPYAHAAWGAGALALIMATVVVCIRHHISRAISTLRDASGAIASVPSLCVEPLLTLAAIVATLAYSIAGLALLISAGERQLTRGAPGWSHDTRLQLLILAHCFGCVWLVAFVDHVGRAAVAGAVAEWYFGSNPPSQPYCAPPAVEQQQSGGGGWELHRASSTQDDLGETHANTAPVREREKERENLKRRGPLTGSVSSGPVRRLASSLPLRLPVLSAYWRIVRFHLGSVAVGALLIALTALVRVSVYAAYRQLRTVAKVHRCCGSLLNCVCCCVWLSISCLEKVVNLLTSHAYVHVLLHGKAFLPAAQAAAKVLAAHARRLAVLGAILLYVTLLGRLMIAGGTVAMALWILRTREPFVSQLVYGVTGPLIAIALEAYVLSGLVLGLYEKTVHALFQCAAIDQAAQPTLGARLVIRFRGRGGGAAKAEDLQLLMQPEPGQPALVSSSSTAYEPTSSTRAGSNSSNYPASSNPWGEADSAQEVQAPPHTSSRIRLFGGRIKAKPVVGV